MQHRPLNNHQDQDETGSSLHYSASDVARALSGDQPRGSSTAKDSTTAKDSATTKKDSGTRDPPLNKGLLGLLFGRTFGGRA